MSIKLQLPKLTDLKPRITVIGVGGAGGNAVNNMISSGLAGVEFVVANTDAQALMTSSAEQRVQLGVNLTEGLGAGSKPEIGEAAAEEALDEVRAQISGSHMVFIACGMGGGTGTGAAAVIARVAKELGILTVGVVTKPFQFEGTRRMRIAEAGIEELKKYVDTLIVIPNQNLFRIASEKTTFAEAFVLADQVLYSGIACIVDLIIKEGLINLDFADVRVVMSGMGSAMMGTGEGEGERRAVIAAEAAIANPLLDGLTLSGAKGLLLSIVGGNDLTLYEVDEAASRVRQEVDQDANIIVGASFDESLNERVRVSIVASGMDHPQGAAQGGLSVPDADGANRSGSAFDAAPETGNKDNTGAAAAGNRGKARSQGVSSLFQKLAGRDGVPDVKPDAAQEAAAMPVTSGPEAAQPQAVEPAPDNSRQPMAWQAPGEVLIEEVAPQLTKTAGPPPIPVAGPESKAPEQAFTPARPEDIAGPPHRIPAVEEFPVVGQRDYHAKTAQKPSGSAEHPAPKLPAPASPPRKAGFFQRLTGRHIPAPETAAERPAAPQGPPTEYTQSYPQPPQGPQEGLEGRVGQARAGTASNERRSSQQPTEDIELPMFFDRGKR